MAWRKKYEPKASENTQGRVDTSASHAREYGLDYKKAQQEYNQVMSKIKDSNGNQ